MNAADEADQPTVPDLSRIAHDAAQRIVQINVSPDLGELRDEMTADTLARVIGGPDVPPDGRVEVAGMIAQLLAAAVQVFADDQRGA